MIFITLRHHSVGFLTTKNGIIKKVNKLKLYADVYSKYSSHMYIILRISLFFGYYFVLFCSVFSFFFFFLTDLRQVFETKNSVIPVLEEGYILLCEARVSIRFR